MDRIVSSSHDRTSLLSTHKVLRNTYFLLSLTLAFSAITATASTVLMLPSPGLILTLVGMYGLMFLTLGLVGQRAEMGVYYWAGLGVAAILVAWEFRLARSRERDDCFRAFLHNNWVGMSIFAGIAADFALTARS